MKNPAALGKSTRISVICILAVFCIITTIVVPSGGLLSSRRNTSDSLNASDDMNTATDAILANIVSGVLGRPKVYPLPMSESAGAVPNKDGFETFTDSDSIEHYIYNDPTISIDCWAEETPIGASHGYVFFSHVKITHPTQIRTAQAGGGYSSLARDNCSVLAASVNALVAINGDLYNYFDDGIIIRQGTLFRNFPTIVDQLFIDDKGDFIIMSGKQAQECSLLKNRTIYNSFQFGPALVIDGKLQTLTEHSVKCPSRNFHTNPRTAIGQLGELEYLLVTVEGRTDRSRGVLSQDLAQLMYDRGCIQAYNLDGGQSSTLYFHDSVFNAVSDGGERKLSEIIYFCSSQPS